MKSLHSFSTQALLYLNCLHNTAYVTPLVLAPGWSGFFVSGLVDSRAFDEPHEGN